MVAALLRGGGDSEVSHGPWRFATSRCPRRRPRSDRPPHRKDLAVARERRRNAARTAGHPGPRRAGGIVPLPKPPARATVDRRRRAVRRPRPAAGGVVCLGVGWGGGVAVRVET